jgi:phosphate:Na+ symporter
VADREHQRARADDIVFDDLTVATMATPSLAMAASGTSSISPSSPSPRTGSRRHTPRPLEKRRAQNPVRGRPYIQAGAADELTRPGGTGAARLYGARRIDTLPPQLMVNILTILGGLGVFLFGLRIFSSGLQTLAGNRLRAILAGFTRNRFTGIVTGFVVTCAVQSSSATTVLVVSFANAGLLTLVQAMGLVMGANIGTTLTGWLVALLGFKVKISAFALPVIAIGFPLSLLGSTRARQLSEVMVGFGLLFLGLEFMKAGVPDVQGNADSLAWFQSWADHGFASILLFIVVGSVLTIVVQSSSASMAITLTMAAKGWIGFEIAAAMVLGENIGTTITAALAAIGANRNATRVARFHTLFNLIGIIWLLPVMYLFLQFVDALVPGDPFAAPGGDGYQLVITAHLAAFHTTFNVLNTTFLVWFVRPLERAVMWLVPTSDGEREVPHLAFLESGLVGTPELAIIEARRALQSMVGVCQDMFGKLQEVLTHPTAKLGDLVDEIKKQEQKTDEMEEEIVAFCSELARAGGSRQVGQSIAHFLDMANDIERMGDHCMNLVLLAQRRYEKGYALPDETARELAEMMALITEFLALASRALGAEPDGVIADAKILESKVNRLRDLGRKSHAKRMQAGTLVVREGLIYVDMLTNMEKLGDYCWNVVRGGHELSTLNRG